MIKIETKKIGIPVVLGELEFTVGTSDKDIEAYNLARKDLLESLEKVNEHTTFDTLNGFLTLGYDTLLGDGAYEKVYEQTPSALECSKYLLELYNGVFDEISKLAIADNKAKVDKYLKKKK